MGDKRGGGGGGGVEGKEEGVKSELLEDGGQRLRRTYSVIWGEAGNSVMRERNAKGSE